MDVIKFDPEFPGYSNYSIDFHSIISESIEYKVFRFFNIGYSHFHFSGVIKDEF